MRRAVPLPKTKTENKYARVMRRGTDAMSVRDDVVKKMSREADTRPLLGRDRRWLWWAGVYPSAIGPASGPYLIRRWQLVDCGDSMIVSANSKSRTL